MDIAFDKTLFIQTLGGLNWILAQGMLILGLEKLQYNF